MSSQNKVIESIPKFMTFLKQTNKKKLYLMKEKKIFDIFYTEMRTWNISCIFFIKQSKTKRKKSILIKLIDRKTKCNRLCVQLFFSLQFYFILIICARILFSLFALDKKKLWNILIK